MPHVTLGDALRLGSAIVPQPHSSEIQRCGVGMVYVALGVRSLECATINLLYPGIIDVGWECPWCDGAEIGALSGALVIQHPFMRHYLPGEITLEQLAEWLDFLSTRPTWKQMQAWTEAHRVIGRLSDGAIETQSLHDPIMGFSTVTDVTDVTSVTPLRAPPLRESSPAKLVLATPA